MAKTNKLDEEAEDNEEENYFHSSFPTTNRKGIGPGLSAGDPVLNKLNKYKMAPKACILTGNCVEVLTHPCARAKCPASYGMVAFHD